MAVHAKIIFRAQSYSQKLREQTLRALLASMNNSGGTISLMAGIAGASISFALRNPQLPGFGKSAPCSHYLFCLPPRRQGGYADNVIRVVVSNSAFPGQYAHGTRNLPSKQIANFTP